MALDTDQYRQLFIDEAKEHIDTITQSMLILEKEPENKEVVNMLFRSAHTLKGSSGMMGFKDFQELTHKMEDVFDDMRKGNSPSCNLISALLECVDALTDRLDRIKNQVDGEIAVEDLKRKLESARSLQKTAETKNEQVSKSPPANKRLELDEWEKKAIENAQSLGEQCFLMKLKFSKDCEYKSIRASMVLDKISEVGKVIKTDPSKGDLDEQKLGEGFRIAITSKFDQKTVAASARQVLEVEQIDVSSFEPIVPLVKDSFLTPASASLQPLNNYVLTIEDKKITKVCVDSQSTQTVRVKFDQLDKLMNWVGELVINKIALLQMTLDSSNESLKHITENIDRLTADLQDLVMQVRMVPVSQIFDRFPRLVRDLSLKKGKKIDMEMEGRDIEIDRTVLDEIGEPLIHLLRNSIDHGIELPEKRINASKNETGKIVLSAQRNGNQVIIEVRDDGAGINPESVKDAALKKGLATQAEVEKMSKEQLINLIFLPGLSTSREVTDTSGRGVGMDVVKTKITALGGTVHIESQIGKGTRTTIKLPITLAIIQAILVKDAAQTFAIPTSQVSEIVRVNRSDVKSLGRTNAIIVRDHVVPMVHLHELLKLPDSKETELELLIVYLADENTKIGLVVDSVVQQQDILVKSLNGACSGIKGISGATILGDGQVVLVLDVGQFVNKAFKKGVNVDSS
ncbi:MAG: chemotaxis protein CheW [Candidatus Bathyarchaeia archaeon]